MARRKLHGAAAKAHARAKKRGGPKARKGKAGFMAKLRARRKR